MASFLKIAMKPDHTEELADYFARIIFDIPPREIAHLKKILPQICAKYPLGIISDTGYISGKYIRKFLEKENVLQYFTSLYFSDEHAHSKPHESVFKHTAKNLGVQLNQLMHIGDLERTDIAGALNSGCIAVKYTGIHTDQPDNGHAHFVISDYTQLKEVVHF
jgi:putative hydrolase of the HAD superfamily